MPFLTQGKTNWKFLLIVIILAIIVGGGALWCTQRPERAPGSTELSKTEQTSAQEQGCLDSEGTVTTTSCCQTATDFPNTCLIGACGCSPDNSHEVKVCDCGNDKCFDGEKCVSQETTQDETADCGVDFDCFIEASKNCNPSKVTNTMTVDIFGVKESVTSYLEIKGIELDKCSFYLRTEKIDLTFPPETDQEIVNQQKELYKKLEGRDGTCKFKTSDLTAMLIRWKAGNFSSGEISCKLTPNGNECTTEGGDFGVAECSGTHFESSL